MSADDRPDDAPVSCSLCGRTEARAPATWTVQTGPRGTEWVCESCTRENLRGIESRLDPEWW